jgi:hypothetical protein
MSPKKSFYLLLCLLSLGFLAACHPKLKTLKDTSQVSILYLDTDNPVTIAGFLSYPAEMLTLMIDNGTITKTNNDIFIARVERLGEAKITILYQGKVLREDIYQVKPLAEKK